MKRARVGYPLLKLFFMVLFLLLKGNSAIAQVTASLEGRVEDSSGAGVPQATVAVTSQETGVTRTVSSDESGNYQVLSLPVGRYQIKVEKAGFKAVVQTGIDLVVGQQAVVNLSLEVGQVQQQVTVTAEAPLVNTTTTSISGLVGEKEVKDLPLNGRSFDNLIALDAGVANVSAEKAGGAGAQYGNLFTVAGRPWFENLFLLNGVEYSGPTQIHSEPGGVSGQLLGIDAVREFNVLTDTYGAEYGKRAGGQVSIVTQSGSNALHGSVFEFLRNSVLDAANYFDHPLGERIPPFKRNQFGGALGGPIQKDKTFIFGNYEGFRQRLGVSDLSFVPDNNARQGLLPSAQGVPTKVAGLAPGMLAYMVYWPVANGPNLGGGIAENFSNPLQSIREDFGTVRVDHIFSGKDQLAGVYTVDDGYNLTPMTDPFFATGTTLRNQVLSLQETHIFSPHVINTATFGLSRGSFIYTNPPLVSIPPNLLFVAGTFPGRLSIGGAGGVGNTTLTIAGGLLTPLYHTFRTPLTYADGIQIVKGRHQISAGVSFQQLGTNDFQGRNASGSPTFSSLAAFLQGTVGTFQVAPILNILHWRQLEGAWYMQDVIQLRPNLTVRLGLRHEFTNGWNENEGKGNNFIYGTDIGQSEAPGDVLLTTPVVGDSVFSVNNSRWLFGPRVGIAWDPFGKGKTSVRAGFGTYYSLMDNLGFVLDDLPPFNGSETFSNVPFLPLVPFNTSAPLTPACGPGVPTPCTTYAPGGINPQAKTPTVEQWNLAVQREITSNTSLSLSYVGSHSYHQEINADPNTIPLQVCALVAGCTSGGVGNTTGTVPQGATYIPVVKRPNSFLAGGGSTFFTVGTESYNALNVELTHRYSSGLQFRANYSWSNEMDIASGWTGADVTNEPGTIMNSYNPKMDWARGSLDVPQKFVLSGSYELPFGPNKPWLSQLTGAGAKLAGGWQINGIVTAINGFPFTPTAGSNRSGDGNTQTPDRPSWNPAFSGQVITGTASQWYNPNAFILPTPGTYGNVGRDALEGPDLREVDMSVFKTTSIGEKISAQFRAEIFNVFNHPNFHIPALPVFSGTAVSPSAGVLTATATTSRQIQFGLKIIF